MTEGAISLLVRGRWVVTGDEIAWTGPTGEEIKLSFAVDPAKRPKEIDVTSTPGLGSTFTVTCSELSGYFGDSGVVLNKTSASIAPGGSQYIDFSADDTPDPDDTDLGSYAVGIVCNLPTHAVMSETYSFWTDEDGVSGA